jgi:hypothetical protein
MYMPPKKNEFEEADRRYPMADRRQQHERRNRADRRAGGERRFGTERRGLPSASEDVVLRQELLERRLTGERRGLFQTKKSIMFALTDEEIHFLLKSGQPPDTDRIES